jgi:hypothetical protein
MILGRIPAGTRALLRRPAMSLGRITYPLPRGLFAGETTLVGWSLPHGPPPKGGADPGVRSGSSARNPQNFAPSATARDGCKRLPMHATGARTTATRREGRGGQERAHSQRKDRAMTDRAEPMPLNDVGRRVGRHVATVVAGSREVLVYAATRTEPHLVNLYVVLDATSSCPTTKFVASLTEAACQELLEGLRQGLVAIGHVPPDGPPQVVRHGPSSWHQLACRGLAGDGCPERETP